MSRQRGALGPLPWSVVVAALSVMDWIDGPLSRRSSAGPRPYGSWLDAEADAWLTFAVALAASQRKVAPSVLLAAPILTLMRPPGRVSRAPGARFTGALQLSVLVFSLGPAGTVCRTFARWPFYMVALCSIGSYAL